MLEGDTLQVEEPRQSLNTQAVQYDIEIRVRAQRGAEFEKSLKGCNKCCGLKATSGLFTVCTFHPGVRREEWLLLAGSGHLCPSALNVPCSAQRDTRTPTFDTEASESERSFTI